MIFNYNPFIIDAPNICQLGVQAVYCKSVSPQIADSRLGCQDLSAIGTLSWSFPETAFTSGDVPPGVYTFTYEVSTSANKEPAVTKEFTVEVELVNPCTNPTLTPNP